MKYVFLVGIYEPRRTVTVHAPTEEIAVERARRKLDRLAEKRGQEPPVAWDLELKSEPSGETQ